MDAGHYISRDNKRMRWDERNVWPQCRSCNRFHEGRKDEYALFLIKRFGPDILEELSKDKWIPYKIDDLQLEEMCKEYKEKLKKL